MRKFPWFRRKNKATVVGSPVSPRVSNSQPQQHTNIPDLQPAKPTWGSAIQEWLAYSELNLPEDQYRSVKHFVRLFRKWLKRRTVGVDQPATYNVIMNPEAIISQVCKFKLELETSQPTQSLGLISDSEHTSSKLSEMGANTRRFITFLDKQGFLDREETQELLRRCALMDNTFRRKRRIEWIMREHNVFFKPRQGGQKLHASLRTDSIRCLFQIADLGENFVLVHTIHDGRRALPPDDPRKIQIPRPVINMLEVGDQLRFDICSVQDADYWVPVSSVDVICLGNNSWLRRDWPSKISGTSESAAVQALDVGIDDFLKLNSALSQAGGRRSLRSHASPATVDKPAQRPSSSGVELELLVTSNLVDEGYLRRRKERLLAGPPPEVGFPESIYTEEWFEAREHDITSDDELPSPIKRFNPRHGDPEPFEYGEDHSEGAEDEDDDDDGGLVD